MKQGFTLIEVVVSLTIMAMVITVLYQAFSVSGRIWSRQQVQGDIIAREQALWNLLTGDFREICPYTFNREKGQGGFFEGGQKTIFYVTTNKFASSFRRPGGLFFCCFYIRPDAEGNYSAYLYKTPYPETRLFKAFDDFQQLPTDQKRDYVPGEEIREKSVLIIDGLVDASFSYGKEQFISLPEHGKEALIEADDYTLPITTWGGGHHPDRLLFSYRQEEKARQLLIPLYAPPKGKPWRPK